MKFWITRYALSRGILTLEAGEPAGRYYYGKGDEWHTTEESAATKANDMLRRRITALEKQLRKLRKMHFCVGGQP